MPIDLKEALGMMHLHRMRINPNVSSHLLNLSECIDELYHRNLDVAALTGSSNGKPTNPKTTTSDSDTIRRTDRDPSRQPRS